MLFLMSVWSAPASAVEVPRDTFVIHEMGWAPVIVLDMTMPFPVLGEKGECRLVMRLNEKSQTTVDIIRCDERFEPNAMRAAEAWVMEVGPLEYYGQEAAFRATFVFDDKDVALHLNEAWLKSPVELKPTAVRTSSLVLDRTAVPKYPRGLRGSGEAAVCLITIGLSRSGKPESVEPFDCPEAFAAEAAKAAKRWRWQPPHSDGERVRAEAVIRMRFKAQ